MHDERLDGVILVSAWIYYVGGGSIYMSYFSWLHIIFKKKY